MLTLDHLEYGYSHRTIGFSQQVHCLGPAPKRASISLIQGRNGTGKTTFLRTVAGLLPTRGGTITWHGRALDEVRESRKVCYLGDRLEFPLSLPVRSIVEALTGRGKANDRLFDRLELPRQTPWGRLSSGQRQKVRLILVLREIERRELIILDEPFHGIDLESRSAILDLLYEALLDPGKRLLICLHHESLPEGWYQNQITFVPGGFSVSGNPSALPEKSNSRVAERSEAGSTAPSPVNSTLLPGAISMEESSAAMA